MVWILILEIRNWHDDTLKAVNFYKNNHKCFGNNLEAILGLKLIRNRVIFRFTLLRVTYVQFVHTVAAHLRAAALKVHIYSEKATKFCEISTVDLSYVVPVKSTPVEISQNCVIFSDYVYEL